MTTKRPRKMIAAAAGWTLALLAGCGTSQLAVPIEDLAAAGEVLAMQLTSSAFGHGQTIPQRHTADGQDLSPPLVWSGAPQGAVAFALICEDPDAPSPRRPRPDPWVHWVIFNIPGDTAELREGIPRAGRVASPAGARQGLNSWPSGNVGYRGPAPPPGSGAHRYFFRLYALDTTVDLEPNHAAKADLLRAIQGHVLAQGELMGVYQRK